MCVVELPNEDPRPSESKISCVALQAQSTQARKQLR